MENHKETETFSYTYSAAQRDELVKIRNKYLPKEEDKMEKLHRLDAGVIQKASMWSLVIGVLGALILGVGMCCVLVWKGVWFIPGIVIGAVGIVGVSMAFPLYRYIVKKERERIAPEILRLTDELMK